MKSRDGEGERIVKLRKKRDGMDGKRGGRMKKKKQKGVGTSDRAVTQPSGELFG